MTIIRVENGKKVSIDHDTYGTEIRRGDKVLAWNVYGNPRVRWFRETECGKYVCARDAEGDGASFIRNWDYVRKVEENVINIRCKNCGRFIHLDDNSVINRCPDCESDKLEAMESDWNSDLSRVKVGDLIATTQEGWVKVRRIDESDYPIVAGTDSFTLDGKFVKSHISPSAFIVPPAYLLDIIGPKPEEIKCAICGKKLARSEDEIFNIDNLSLCDTCARTVKKYNEAKQASAKDPDC